MMRFFLSYACVAALFFLTSLHSLQGQVIILERTVVATGGASASQDSVLLSFTVGEAITPTAITLSGTLVVTMGFQQPIQELDFATSIPHELEVGYTVFPNPTTGLLFLTLSSDRPVTLLADVLDTRGRKTTVPSQRLSFVGTNESIFNLAPLADGMYLLQVRSLAGDLVETFKIQKVH